MSETVKKLFSEFEIPSRQDWMNKIIEDLKGENFENKLVWRTNEGFNVSPFYRRDDNDRLSTPDSLPGEFPFVRGYKIHDNDWYVRQNILVDSVESANKTALDILNKGVNSLCFILQSDTLEDCGRRLFSKLLDGIYCECIELNFEIQGNHSLAFTKALVSYFDERKVDKEKIVCSIEWSPIVNGFLQKESFQVGVDLLKVVADYPHIHVLAVNALDFSKNGAYIVQELGYALAWGADYLQHYTDLGVDPTEIACRVKFNMGISENYFMEIAKFRAARMLWAQVVKKFSPRHEFACQMCVNAETSLYNMTLYDPYINMLRSQTETMSASIAGVNSIVVNPFDSIYVDSKNSEGNTFSKRIARNQQLLLKEESHFDKVVDPSAGSYYIEHLTNALAEESWKLFLKIEDEGGFFYVFESGTVMSDIRATDVKRHSLASQRREFILGTNQFPDFGEKSNDRRPLPIPHLASDFESLRMATDSATKRPVAFMVTIGHPVWRQARAQFSCNYLAAAGYKVIDNLGFITVEEGIDAAVSAHADMVVLCSSDEEYSEFAIPAFNYLRGRALFVVAGNPPCIEELKSAGIEYFIHVKANQLDMLKMLNAKLGL